MPDWMAIRLLTSVFEIMVVLLILHWEVGLAAQGA